jgi:CDP-L-myo-inositol myo-inositolphosphotransferase
MEAGADEFYVVTGYQEERVRSFLKRLTDLLNIRITPITNKDWEKENGISVLKAREYLDEPFLLLMADHLFDPSIARDLMGSLLLDGEISLCTDCNSGSVLIDQDDVTRVKTSNGKIIDIGKKLSDFTCFDTGIFLCTPSVFDVLARCEKEQGDTTLSGAVRMLAAEGRAKAFEISGRFWIDVDDPAALCRAENTLLTDMRDKPNDGPVSRYINRPLSVILSRRLVKTGITPNQISLFSFFCSLLAAGLFALEGHFTLLLGGILAQFASVIDGCDGEVARLKFLTSEYGGWLDAVLDRYADALLLFGLTWHAYMHDMNRQILAIGFLAIIGSFVCSYTADKYDGMMRSRIDRGKGLRMGRDIRVFLIFLSALFNQAYVVLVLIAVVMNLETIRRLVVCRNNG